MTKKSKLLFVDFNGVLSYKHFWFTLEDTNPQTKHKIEDYLFNQNPQLVKDWMNGMYTSEQIVALLSEEKHLDYNYIWKVFVQDCKDLDVSMLILNKLNQMKDEFYLVHSTGNMDCFNRWTLPANPMMSEVFDRIDNSYNLGYQKNHNDGKYFKKTIAELGFTPNRSYVVDDSAKVCKVFADLGGTALCVTGEANVLKVLNTL
jgi:hypothetical protein